MVKMSENSRRLAELLIRARAEIFPADKLAFFDDGGRPRPGVFLAAFRPSDLHRLRRDRAGGHGQRRAQPDAGDARTRRQVAGDRRAGLPASRPPPSAFCGPRPSTPARCASLSTTCFLPRGRGGRVRRRIAERLFAERYPDINGPDFTSIIDQRSYDRLDCGARGRARQGRDAGQSRRRADGPTRRSASSRRISCSIRPADMELMRREIFGPILPVRVYDDP